METNANADENLPLPESNPESSVSDNQFKQIDTQIETMKRECFQILPSEYIDDFEKYFSVFKQTIKQKFDYEFGATFDGNFNKILKKTKNQITFISQVQCLIISSIKINLELIKNLLSLYSNEKHLRNGTSYEQFVNSNLQKMLSSSVLLNIDVSNLRWTELPNTSSLPKEINEILLKNSQQNIKKLDICKETRFTTEAIEKKKLEVAKTKIETNVSAITTLKFENIDEIRSLTVNNVFPKMTILKFKNCVIKNIDFETAFPNLNILHISRCNKIINPSFILLNLKLRELSFEKCNITTKTFVSLLTCISSYENIQKHLQLLSFAKNNITTVDMSTCLTESNEFSELTEINFRSNKIYKFQINNDKVPKLQFINLSNNCLSACNLHEQFRKEKVIIFTTNNFYLCSEQNTEKYLNKIKPQLSTYNYNIKYLSLNRLFLKNQIEDLLSLKMTKSIQFSLQTIDLSNCSLTSDVLLKFLKNNTFIDLRVLKLSNNKISDTFFEGYINHKLFLASKKLSHVYMDSNNITGTNFNHIAQFIFENKCLSKLILTNNPFCSNYEAVNLDRHPLLKKADAKEGAITNWNTVNDFPRLWKYCLYLDGEEGRKERKNNKNEKGFYFKMDVKGRFNFDNGEGNVKYAIGNIKKK